MNFIHCLLAVLITLIWGFNFIFVRIALDGMSPYLLCALRFIFASIPLIFFIRPPAVHVKWIIAYGLVMFALQFLLLFLGISAGVSPGLASLIAQVQIFFSILYAAILWNEIPTRWQIAGALVAFSGIGVVAMNLNGNLTLLGFIFVLGAAASWALGNVITKSIGAINIMSLVVWGSFVACFPMILMSLYMDGSHGILTTLQNLHRAEIISVLYIIYISTLVGYGLWSFLLSTYTVSVVVPFTLLIPIFGMLGSIVVLHEPLQSWKILAAVLVISGLIVNLLGAHFYKSLIADQNCSKNGTS